MGFIDEKIRMATEVMRQNQKASHLEVRLDEAMTQDPLAYIKFLLEQLSEKDLREKAMMNVMQELSQNNTELVQEVKDVKTMLTDIREQLRKSDAYGKSEHRRAEKYKEQLQRLRREKFASKQQKAGKNDKSKNGDKDESASADSHDLIDRQQGEHEYEGSETSAKVDKGSKSDESKEIKSSSLTKQKDLSNRPAKYNTMSIKGATIDHPGDESKVTGRIEERRWISFFTLELCLVQHRFETFKCRVSKFSDKLGKKIRTHETSWYRPDGKPVFIGNTAKASPELMQALAYEVYVKNVSQGNVHKWLLDLGMELSPATLGNWLEKGKRQLDKSVMMLRDMAVEKDSILHCDETWCKVRRYDKYRKCYLWAVINTEKKIVIYFYDNGSRGRSVIKDFLGDAEIKALMTDGYTAYNFIDGQLENFAGTDHLADLAHIRSNFVDVENAGTGETVATEMREWLDELLDLDREWRIKGLSVEEIGVLKKSPHTKSIIAKLHSRLLFMLKEPEEKISAVFLKALKYLYKLWDKFLNCFKDGRYPLTNNVAERAMRHVACARNNYVHFGSDAGVKKSAVYLSVIETFKAKGLSCWTGFGDLFGKLIYNFDHDPAQNTQKVFGFVPVSVQ